ncbi:hypothetical protein LAZ67_10000882 [Cordylochernes scorpioides]|uniref:RNA-directed DNA polymerase n=1 Tax=Cordylochernes scorpioides TaxID=51811 RepID=A0ABY6KVU2_9ARAC|nr:hypothetical protein LAZ67_10000882 [Cordylochernes scorpioides]
MFKDSGMTLKVADGKNVTSIGRCTISLSINGLEQPLEFIVLPNSNPSIILGWDFLEASNAVIDCGRAEIRLEEAKDVLNSPASMGKVVASRSVVIPAESTKLINVMSEELNGQNQVLFEPSKKVLIGKGLTLPCALFRLSHNKGKLWVVNSSTTAQIVPKGMCLGKIQRVEENNLTAISECSESNKEVKNANHASHADKSDFKFLQNLISDDLSEEQQSQILSILKRYDKIFDKNNESVKQTSLAKHKIETGNHQPIKHRPYRVSPTERQAIQTEVDKMLDAGIIRHSESPWSSPVILVKKKDGNWRFCVDYRRLNKVTKKDVYPLPRIDDTLDSLKGAKFYSSMDLRSGYWQIEVDEADREKTAFITPDGLYEFLVMPFGLCNAPATFERMMDKILKGLKWTMALCYLDDIVVYSKSFNEHLHRLEIILQCLDKAELRLNPKKCLFGTKRIRVFGHLVDSKGIYPDPEKIEAIAKFPTPKSITDVRSFIGLCSYYRRFIENFAEKAAPLHEVLKKDNKFMWNSDQQDAFDSVKKALMSEPVLAYFEEQLPTELHTDASGYGIGAVLVQINDGKERPVGYASRTLSKAEKNYSTTERECLAAIWAINKFRPYLFGHADCLSRNPLQLESEEAYNDEDDDIPSITALTCFEAEQRKDPKICKLIEETERFGAESKGYEMLKGTLYKKNFDPLGNQHLLVIPKHLRLELLKSLHDAPTEGHLGFSKTYERVKNKYFWPGLLRDIRKYVAHCKECQRKKQSTQKPPGLLKAIPPATSAFQRVGMDLLGRFPKSDNGNKWIIVCTDYLTRFAVTKALPTGEAKEAAKFLMEDVVLKHGAPREIITDRGRVFQSKLIAELTNQCSSIHRFTTAYHPQTNGLTERLNKTLANMIAMYVSVEQKDWDVILPYVTFAYNTAKQDTTGFTPFKLIHGREAETTVDTLFPNPHEDLQEDYSQKIASRVEETRQLARLETLKAQEKDKARYDSKHEAMDYNVGDLVWIFIPIRKVGLSEKLMKRYFGPYRVTRKLSDVTFEVEPVDQPTRRRKTRDLVHVLRMKPYHDPEDQANLFKIFQGLISTLQLVERLDRYPLRNKRKIDSVEPEETSMNVKKEGTQVSNYVVQNLPRNPSIFSGEDGEDLQKWLKGYARVARYNHWDETLCLTKVYFYLSGTALKWFENNEESIQTWKEFTSQLENVFEKKENSKLQAEKKLKTRAQLKGESTEFYIQDVLCLCEEVDPQMSVEDKISHLMKGIAEELYQALLPRDVQSTEQFITECRRVEALRCRRVTPTRYERLPNVASLCDQDDGEDLSSLIRKIVREEIQQALDSPQEEPKIAANEDLVREEIVKTLAPISKPTISPPQAPRPVSNPKFEAQPRNPHPTSQYQKQGRRRDTNEWRTTEGRPICFYCGRPGHVVRYCRDRKRHNEERRKEYFQRKQDAMVFYNFRAESQDPNDESSRKYFTLYRSPTSYPGAERRREEEEEAAVRIQRWWRWRRLVSAARNKRWQAQVEASNAIKMWWKRRLLMAARKKKQQEAVAVIKKWWRALNWQKSRNLAAIIIQSSYRGWKCRQKFDIVRAYLAALKMCEGGRTFCFEEIFAAPTPKKLGEGKFGEVYGLDVEDSNWVFKIIPISVLEWEKKKGTTELAHALKEVRISMAISKLREPGPNSCQGFTFVDKVWMVQGSYPEPLRKAAEDFAAKSKSILPDLIKVGSVHYIVLKMEDAGRSLDSYAKQLKPKEVLSILSQVSCSLAVAEKFLEFEHRDLHSGNVLLQQTSEKKVEFHYDGRIVTVPSCGLKATTVDFGCSRLKIGDDILWTDLSAQNKGLPFGEIVDREGDGDYSRFFPVSNRIYVFLLGKPLMECLKRHDIAFNRKFFALCEKAQVASSLVTYYEKVLLPPLRQQRKQPEALNPPAKRPNLKGPTKLASSRVSKPAAAQVVLHGEKSAAHTVVVSDDPQADPRDIYKAVRAVHTLPQGVWASLRTKGKLVLHSSNPDIIPEVTTSLASKLTGMKVRQQKEILPRICLFRVDEETSNSTIEETFLATAAVSQLPGNKVVRVAHRSALRNGTCTAFIEVDLKTFGALGNRGRIVVDGVILNFEASIRARVCFRCCGFGHNSTHCSRAPKCFHCGEDGHEGRSCPTRADQHTSKCANYCQKGLSGNHEARASNCPILKSKARTFHEGEDLNCYLEQLEEYFKLNKTSEADKVSVLLTSIDVNVYKTLRDLLVPSRPSDLKYKDLVEVLTNHLYPIKNKHYERYLFHKIVQKENEPVGKFVLRLKSQADKCKFTDINENLCDQFVSGCYNEATLKRLLSEPFLTFDSAINIANSVEAAKLPVNLMKNPSHDIDKLKARSNNFKFPCKYNNPCNICGKSNHDTKLCELKNAQCYICNKKGHIASVCSNKKSAQNSGMNKPNLNKLNTIQCNTLENAPKILVNVKIEDADTIMEVDTGADVSVVSKKIFLTNFKNVTLEKYSGHLKSFSGNLIPVFGKCLVNVSYKNYQEKLPLIVTGQFNNQTPLLGRNWIRILKADWPNCVFDICNSINVISNLELFLEAYKRVFENKDLPIQGIKEKIDKELDRLEQSQIIEKVNASDWSTPLVTVIKSNGELRLCGDFKNTLNNCIEDEKYPLSTIETMLGNVGGNKIFTKLDLSSAYHQIEMNEASKNLLVVSTHRGLYRYNRLPFGISPASAIFQRCHIINEDGVRPDSKKLEALERCKKPFDKTSLKSFLGMLSFYSKYIPNMSTLAGPLYQLLKKDNRWKWSSQCEKAFLNLKLTLLNSQALIHYSMKLPLTLTCDASAYGISEVLCHIVEGEEKPITFVSRTLSSAEAKYSQTEKEALAIVMVETRSGKMQDPAQERIQAEESAKLQPGVTIGRDASSDPVVLNPNIDIPKYDGTEDPRPWIESLEEIGFLYHWADYIISRYAAMNMTGSAKTWLNLHKASFTSWENIKIRLIQDFSLDANKEELRMKLNRMQHWNEPAIRFAEDILVLCNKVDPAMEEETKIEHVIGGLKKEYSFALYLNPPKTTDDLLVVCKKMDSFEKKYRERVEKSRNLYNGPRYSRPQQQSRYVPPTAARNYQTTSRPQAPVSNNYKNDSHPTPDSIETTFPSPLPLDVLIILTLCRNQTFRETLTIKAKKFKLSVAPESVNQSKSTINGIKKLDPKYKLKINVDKIGTFEALVDTGADLSVVDLRTALDTGHGISKLAKICAGPDGKKLDMVGSIFLNIKIDDETLSHNFVILKTHLRTLILGRDFLKKMNAKIDCKQETIKYDLTNNHDEINFEMLKIKSAKDSIVPECSMKLIKALVETEDGEYIIEESSKMFQTNGLRLARSLINVINRETHIWITNPYPRPLKIMKNQTLAFGSSPAKINVSREREVEKNEEPRFQINENLSPKEQKELKQVLERYGDLFSSRLGRTNLAKHRIDTEDAKPIKHKPYRVSAKERDIIKEQIDEMLTEGIIRPSSSPWSFPVILVKKRDGKYRFCVDYRKLNNVTVKDVYPIPRIDEVMDTLQGSTHFSAIDLRSGYWQVEVEERDKEKTAFTTAHGLYEFNVMPFGLCNAPATFERNMENMLGNLRWQICLCYLDDVIIYSPDFPTHLKRLEAVFRCFRESNLRLNDKKCRFAFEELEILGYITSKHGIKPAEHNIKAVRNFPRPRKVKEVQSFLGMCSYYRKFIKDFSKIADPLTNLIKKSVSFTWTERQEEAFQTLKTALLSPPILGHFNPNAPTYVHTDASNIGIGATLVQDIGGEEKVISYLSRTLSKAEQNYSTTEKECLAVVWSMSKLRPYLYGRHFKIVTDHHALCWLKNLKDPTGRLARWALKIQEYDFDIIHKSGKKHLDADGLSRGPLPETDWDEDFERLFLNQITDEEDKFIESVKKNLNGSRRSIAQNFKEEDGCLFKKNPNPEGRAWLLVVPENKKREIMKEYHNHMSNGHLGVARTMYRIKSKYFWPSMLKDVSEFVRTCHLCQSRKGSNQLPSGLLQPIPPANFPFERIGIDFVGPLPSTKNRKKWIIVLTDYYTRYAETRAVSEATVKEVSKFLVEDIFLRHGAPQYLISDRGSQFTSNLMKEVMKTCKIKHCFTTSYHPQTNGLTERLNRTLINMLSMYVNTDQKNWDEILPFITHAYNTTIQETTGYSPFFLMFGREPTSLLDDRNISVDIDKDDYDEYIKHHLDKINRTRKLVINNTIKTQERMKKNYDKKHMERSYEPGELVAVWTPIRKIGKCEKLLRKYFGPYRILKKLSNVNYLIEPKDNPGQDPLIVHVSRIKPYFERIDEVNHEDVTTSGEGEVTNQPWQRVHVDHFYFRGDCYLLVVYANSNWIEVFPVRSTTSQENIELLRECFARYGLPQCLVSDNGPPFNSLEFKEFLRKNNVYHLTSPAYNPSSNGIAEVSVRIIKKSLEKSLEESPNSNMDCILQNVLFNYRNTPTSLDKPPVERLLSYVPRTFVNFLNSEFIQRTFWRNECGRQHFQVGDKVLFTGVIQNRHKWFKAQVIRRLGYNVYLVKNLKGTFKVHVNQMRTGSDSKYAEDSDWTLDNAGAGPHRLEQDPQVSTSPPPRRSTRPRCPPCRFSPTMYNIRKEE